MYNPWGKYPFLRFLFLFVIGIFLADYINVYSVPFVIVIFGLVGLYILLIFKSFKNHSVFLNTILGIIGLGLLVTLGVFHSERYNSFSEIHFSQFPNVGYYKARISSDPLNKTGCTRFEAIISNVKSDGSWKSCKGQIRIYVKGKCDALEYGDDIVVKGHPSILTGPRNPDEVDFKRIFMRKKIDGNHFMSPSQIHLLEKSDFSIIRTSYRLRHLCDSILKENISNERNYQIASGLILGLANNIDEDIQNAYSHTGVIHILAVSGMHVVLIFYLLSTIFKGVDYLPNGNKISSIAIIFLLFCYSYLTGFSPSVVRAVVMLSFVIAGKSFSRYSNGINILALSAFVMLLYNPNYIYEVSFQLSFLAVLGIILLNPLLLELYIPDNRIKEYLWNSSAISVAATSLTFPLTIYYFQQFPWYFLPTNLIVVPLSSFVMYFSFPVLFFSSIPLIGHWLGKILEALVFTMNSFVAFVEQIPGAFSDNLSISLAQVIILYICLFALFALIFHRKFIYCIVVALFLLMFQILSIRDRISSLNQNYLGVYLKPENSVYAIVESEKATVFTRAKDENLLRYLKLHFSKRGIEHSSLTCLDSSMSSNTSNYVMANNKFIIFGDCKFLLNRKLSSKVEVDYLIANSKNYKQFKHIMECVKPKLVVIDSSVKKYQARELKKRLEGLAVKYVDINVEGGKIFKL